MDVINLISKVSGLPDAPIANPREEYQPAPMYYANGLAPLFSLLRGELPISLEQSVRTRVYKGDE